MGKTELEEGAACCSSYIDNDQNIDIDIAFSYIDKRIQDVLGHHQKEFEGGLSAENLGARFGGYGSFLPTYQWSPSTCSKTSQQAQNNHSHDLPLEGAPQNSKVIMRPELASTYHALPELRNSSVDSLSKVCNSRNYISNHKPLKLSTNQSDKKTLKFRIKVGSDNILTEKSAAIYSNLGLDMSPSSSSDGSHTEWEGNSPDSHSKQSESPSCIIKIMTSFPIPNGVLLSPLHDNLVCPLEEKNLLDGSRSPPFKEMDAVFENEFASKMHCKKVLREKKKNFGDKNERFVESKNGNFEDPVNPVNAGLKNEEKIKISVSKEIASDILKLPPKSSKHTNGGGLGNGIAMAASEPNMGKVKEKNFSSHLVKEETLGSIASRSGDEQNTKNGLAEMIQKDKNVVYDIRKDGRTKDDRSCNLFERNCDMPKGSKVCDWGTAAPIKQNCESKATHQQDGVNISHGKESAGGQKKSKEIQNHDSSATRKSKVNLKVSCSSASKDNVAYKSGFPSKSKGDEKLHKDLEKAKDSQSESMSNKKLVKKECVSDTSRNPLKDQGRDSKLEVFVKKFLASSSKSRDGSGTHQAKDSKLEVSGKKSVKELSGKGYHAISNKSKETLGKDLAKDHKLDVSEKESYAFSHKLKERSGYKQNDLPSSSEAHLKGHMKGATKIPDPRPSEVAPVVIEENWVCCDKCEKWRLLPYGTNPDHLPKKWLCSMLTWLPGMNQCSFSEEETTNALNALYQVPISQIQNNQQTYPVGTAPGGTLLEAPHLNQNCQDLVFSAVTSGGKNKLRAKTVSNEDPHIGSKDVLNFKKNQQVPVKSKGLQNLKQCSLESKSEERPSNTKSLKTSIRREYGQDGCRPSKKAKTESTHCTNQDQNPGGLSKKEVETDIQKYNERCSSDIKGVPQDGSFPSVKQSKKQGHRTFVEDNDKSSFARKKRKLNERQGIQIHMNDLPSNRQDFKDEQISMEEASGRQCRKEKKGRALKLQGNETNTRKASSEPEKQGTVTRILLSSSKNNPLDRTGSYEGRKISKKDQHFGQCDGYNLSQWTVDGNNSFRRDFGGRHPCIAATSSSSMISGTGKDGSADVGLALTNSPGTYLVVEDDGRSQHYESIRKEKAFTVIQDDSSVSPSFDYQGRFTDHKIHGKAKLSTVHTSNIRNSHLLNVCIENDKHTNEPSKNHHFHDMARVNSHCSPKKYLPEKSTNGCSSQAKERHSTPISDLDKSNIRISESFNEQEESDNVHYEVENGSHDITPYKKDIKVRKIKIQGNKSTKIEKNHSGKKASAGKCLSDSSKRVSQTLCDRLEDPYSKGGESTASRQNLLQNHDDEKYLKWLPSERNFQEEEATENSDDFDVLPFDDFNGGDSVKASQQLGKDDCQNKLHHVSSRHPTCNRDGNRNIVAPSHRRKDASTCAANKTLKEAEDLKHSADQLKISGSELESIEARFQAALKFLHGASLLDPCNSKSAKYGEMTSTAAYSSTAKLFEYCACEYERCKDMASAALAYKCLEVTFMRMIYVNHFIASSDQNELQKTLQMVSPVQSPSSSASDVDNLYNQAMMDKMDIAKDGSSLQVTGNHVIAARNHPKLVRLLDFAQDVNFAMEASRKSQISFAAANVVLAKTRNEEVISSIKRTLDFNFHDVEELLRLVHLAMKALSSS
ncbi:hypothetical protein ACJW31_03G036800 [Castanea mollissima]